MTPFLSVIVPTCHRDDLLSCCLDRLAPESQSLSSDEYEVIVTDDGGNHTAESLIKTRYSWARWVKGPGRGPAANRNNGARCASGEWLAFVDDDCLPGRDWLKAIYECALSAEVEVVEGKVSIPDKVDNPFLRGIENPNGGNYWSCNLAIRKLTFEHLGGFDEDFLEAGGEDMELAWRFKTNKIATRFVEEAIVDHPVRPVTWHTLIWRTFLIRWMILFYQKTGQSPPLSDHSIKALTSTAKNHALTVLRRLWHFIKAPPESESKRYWRSSLFYLTWDLLTLPLVIPYLVLWETRFRRQLSSRLPQKTTLT